MIKHTGAYLEFSFVARTYQRLSCSVHAVLVLAALVLAWLLLVYCFGGEIDSFISNETEATYLSWWECPSMDAFAPILISLLRA